MPTRTHFVFLMHPKEFKEEKANTGRLTHLCLPNSRIIMGVNFDADDTVQSLLRDPANHCVLLYPGPQALNLSRGEFTRAELGSRQLTVFILDGTWSLARKMLRLSPTLQQLPRVMFAGSGRSRYVIKQQPEDGCLSTLEATHELLLSLGSAGLDRYPDREQLLAVFDRMQDFQLRCAADPTREGYRRRPYSAPETREASRQSGKTRRGYFPRLEPPPRSLG